MPDYRSSGKIHVASTVPVAPLAVGGNTNSHFLRFFVRSVPLFRSLMLTTMGYINTRRKSERQEKQRNAKRYWEKDVEDCVRAS